MTPPPRGGRVLRLNAGHLGSCCPAVGEARALKAALQAVHPPTVRKAGVGPGCLRLPLPWRPSERGTHCPHRCFPRHPHPCSRASAFPLCPASSRGRGDSRTPESPAAARPPALPALAAFREGITLATHRRTPRSCRTLSTQSARFVTAGHLPWMQRAPQTWSGCHWEVPGPLICIFTTQS